MGGDTLDSNVVVEATKVPMSALHQHLLSGRLSRSLTRASNLAQFQQRSPDQQRRQRHDRSCRRRDWRRRGLEALKAASSTDSKAVNEALWDVTYDGVSGHIAFDEIGDAARDSAYIKTANTETGAQDFVTVQTVE